jgi:hypothetical protein
MFQPWLFHVISRNYVPSIIDDVVSHYPLVMTNIAMENHHAIKNGKPSINGPIFHGELLVITRG